MGSYFGKLKEIYSGAKGYLDVLQEKVQDVALKEKIREGVNYGSKKLVDAYDGTVDGASDFVRGVSTGLNNIVGNSNMKSSPDERKMKKEAFEIFKKNAKGYLEVLGGNVRDVTEQVSSQLGNVVQGGFDDAKHVSTQLGNVAKGIHDVIQPSLETYVGDTEMGGTLPDKITGDSGASGTGTNGTGTGGTGTGEKTEEKTQPYSYAQYLNDAESSLKEYTKFLEELAADTKSQAIEDAENEFQRASADAQAAYSRNLATYGSQAEELSRMGLSGSGYSDYLQGQAHSQMRSDVNTATGAKNTAIQTANRDYTNAILAANKYENEKQAELNAAKGTYYDTLAKEKETKEEENKKTLMSQIMTMAQNGASAADIQNYVSASGIALSTEELNAVGAISTQVIGRMKSELIAQALLNGYNVDQIKAIAQAAGLEFSEDELTELQTSIDAVKEEIKSDEDLLAVNTILTHLLSLDGGVNSLTKSELEGYVKSFGLDPSEGTGAAIMSMHDDVINENARGYRSGIVDENSAGKILTDAVAKKAFMAGSGDDGNITVEYDDEKYGVQRASAGRISPDSDLAAALTDSYRLKNNLSIEQWQAVEDEDVEGTVMKYGDKLYAYLYTKDQGYGWVELEKRDRDGALGGKIDYDELMDKFDKTDGDISNDVNDGGYGSGIVDENSAGKILTDAEAKVAGGKGEHGNVTITLDNEDYHVQRVSDGKVGGEINTKLTDSYRLAKNISVKQWKEMSEEDIEGTVMEYEGKLYAYLETRDDGYGWVELESRDWGAFGTNITAMFGGNIYKDDAKLLGMVTDERTSSNAVDFGDNFIGSDDGKNGSNITIVHGGTNYNLQIGEGVDDETRSKNITQAFKNAGGSWDEKNGTNNVGKSVWYNGQLYVYYKRVKKDDTSYRWGTVTDRAMSYKGSYKALKTALGYE